MKVKTSKIFMKMERLKELRIVFSLSVILIEFLLKWIETLIHRSRQKNVNTLSKKRISKYINDKLEISSDNCDEEASVSEAFDNKINP